MTAREKPGMHVHVVADDVFFPTNSGGRVEALESTRALLSAGAEVSCTLMQREELTALDARHNAEVLPDTVVLQRPGFAATSLRHPLQPYQLASRTFPGESRTLDSRPDVVLAHHEWALPYARRVAREHGARLVLRSHNDELTYLRSLRDPAPLGVHKAYYSAELARARRAFSRDFYRGVEKVLVIADGDLGFYRERDVPAVVVPPSLGLESAFPVEGAPQGSRIVFAGSMDMPYVVAGLRWFVDRVLPRIVREVPDVLFQVMGRRAPEGLAAELGSAVNVEFLGEVDDTLPLVREARVFVNPVFEGSGLNMKVGPPSALGIPVVTTPIGARGLGDLGARFAVTGDDVAFAQRCTDYLRDDALWGETSRALIEAAGSYSRAAVAERYREVLGIRVGGQGATHG